MFGCVSYSAGDRSILFLFARVTFSKFWYHLNLVLWLAFAASYSSVCPSAIGCALFLAFAGIVTDSFHSPTHRFSGFFHARTLLSCCLDPLASSVCFTDGYHEDSFLKGAVPYFFQKSIALFRRFVLLAWNSLIFIAITLIVSVTASRRVPRTGRMLLLLPLDSPLSPVVFGYTPILSE